MRLIQQAYLLEVGLLFEGLQYAVANRSAGFWQTVPNLDTRISDIFLN